MKKVLVIIILVVISSVIIIDIMEEKNNINVTELSKFSPFKNINNITEESELKINEDLPTIDASIALYPLVSNIIERIYDKNSYNNELNYVSTNDAYTEIINGKVDAIIVTQPSDEQQNMIENSKVNLKFVPFAKEALIFYTNNKNNINNLSIKQIEKIYHGEITNWNEVGGQDKKILTYQLEKNNGSQTCFETIAKNNIIDENNIELKDMGDIIQRVVHNKNSIGYAFNSFYNNIYNSSNLRIISIDNIEANKENIITGIYPFMYDVYFVYNQDNLNENLKSIENWLLTNECKKIVELNELNYNKSY